MDMIDNKQPLVSVNVLMYNSANYILETLESIKAQTYQNIELIMSDDKSTDNTVLICEDWIANNKERFVSYKIVVPEQNTGQSGNYNRAFDASTGDWIKEIDGDDLLLPNCIEDCIAYVNTHCNAKYIFGKMSYIGATQEQCARYDQIFDYSFFKKTPDQQLEQLVFKSNCIPSPCSFYNRQYMLEIGFRCDERIPFLEDWPKWITLLKKGVTFHHFDKFIASYRINSGISTTNRLAPFYYKTNCLFDLYYRYPEWLKRDENEAVLRLANKHCRVYERLCNTEDQLYAAESQLYRFKNPIWIRAARKIGRLLKKCFHLLLSLIHI